MRSRLRLKRWTAVALLALVASAILSACGDNSATITNPQGPVALRESNIWWFILILASVIFFGVTIVLLISVFRFRARPDAPEARQIHGNTTIEIIWTAVPTLVLFGILAVTVSTMFSLAKPADPNTLNVTALGHQWWFEFRYPNNGNVVTADELHVPVGTTVDVKLFTDNVIHSFWIPELAGKTDMIPGHDNRLWFKADKTGTYRGECAEFCGAQHAHMDFYVVVQDQAAYSAWLAQQQLGPANPAAGTAEARGQAVFRSAGCSGCHAIGTPPKGAVLIGPNLTHFGSRGYIAGGVLTNTTDNLKQWVYNAQGVKPDSDMPSFDGSAAPQFKQLTPSQLDDLVAYLQSLK